MARYIISKEFSVAFLNMIAVSASSQLNPLSITAFKIEDSVSIKNICDVLRDSQSYQQAQIVNGDTLYIEMLLHMNSETVWSGASMIEKALNDALKNKVSELFKNAQIFKNNNQLIELKIVAQKLKEYANSETLINGDNVGVVFDAVQQIKSNFTATANVVLFTCPIAF